MTEAVANANANPQQKLQEKIQTEAIAPRPTRRYRAQIFQAYVLGASAAFVALAVLAHTNPYFPIDLTITRLIQSYHGAWFDRLMFGLSWIGFMPQVYIIGAVVVVAAFIMGLRWEGVSLLFAAVGVGVGTIVKLIVYRPRPSADLIHVINLLPSSGFPSGHVLTFTTFCGFLVFLVYTLLKPSPWRTGVLVMLGLIIGLMGISRMYEGQHWFSDVMGAHLLGSLWLMLTIRLYRWGKPKFFVAQPVAPDPTPASA
jgi:undecaprenyl-diphosphatase